MTVPRIDSSRFPLVVVIYGADLDIQETDIFAAELRKLYERGRLAVVADINQVSLAISPSKRRHIAARLDEITTAYPGRIVAEAVVTTSALIRGMFTAFDWLRRDKSYARKTFADIVAATLWAKAELQKAGLSV